MLDCEYICVFLYILQSSNVALQVEFYRYEYLLEDIRRWTRIYVLRGGDYDAGMCELRSSHYTYAVLGVDERCYSHIHYRCTQPAGEIRSTHDVTLRCIRVRRREHRTALHRIVRREVCGAERR